MFRPKWPLGSGHGSFVSKHVVAGAFESFQKLLQSLERNISLTHFHPVQRGRGNPNFTSKGRVAQIPALFSQEVAKLLLQ